MERIDLKILDLLQRDSSCTNAALAEAVGLSPSTCLRRVRRLVSSGVVSKVVAILDPAKVGKALKAIVTVELKSHGEEEMRRFLALAKAEPAVTQAYAVTGSNDVLLILRIADMDEFDAFCERVFRDRTNVARFHTMVVLRTAKDETALAL